MAQNSLTSTDKEIVIDLKIDGAKEALAAVSAATKEIAQLKKEKKAYDDMLKEEKELNADQWQDYIRVKTALKDQQNTLKANQRVLDEQVKAYKKNEDSINSMRAKLKLLRAQYEDLSKAERDSAKGTELVNKIKNLNDEIKSLESSQGDFTRNVGNYQSVWDANVASIQKFGGILASVFGSNSIIGKAATVVQGFGKAMSDIGKQSQDMASQVTDSANKTSSSIGDVTSTTQEYTQAVQQNASAVSDQASAQQNAETVVRGFGAAEREAADAAKEAATSAQQAAQATDGVADGVEATADAAKASAKGVSSLSQAFGVAGNAVKGFAVQMKALMTNPYVAAIAAIVVIVMKLVDAFKKNDAAMTALQKAMAPFKAILEVINRAFTAIVNTITKAIEKIADFGAKLVSFIPGMKKYVDQQNDIVDATDKLEDRQREYAVNAAKREAEISELRNKSVESEKYTAAERRKFLERAIELEKQDVEERRANAEEELRIAEQKALAEIGYTQMTAEAWEALSDEEKDSITQLRVNVENLTAEFNNSTRKMTAQLNNFDKEEKKKQQDRAKAAKEAAKERLKIEQEAARALEDILFNSIKDAQAKEEQLARTATARQIQTIKDRIKTEKNLSTQAKRDLNRQIVLLEADLQIQLNNIRQKYASDNIKKQLEAAKQHYELMLKSMKTDDAKMQIEFEIVDLDTQLLKMQFAEAKNIAHQAVDQINSDIDTLTDKEFALKYKVEIETDEDISKLDNIHDQKLALQLKYQKAAETADADYNNNVIELDKQAEQTKTRIRIEGQSAREAIAQRHKELMIELETGNALLYETDEVKKTQILQEQAQKRLQLAQEEHDRLKNLTQDEVDVLYGSQEEYNNALIESSLKVNEAQQSVIDSTKAVTDAMQAQRDAAIDSYSQLANAINGVLGNLESLFDNLAESDDKYRKYSTALAMTQILISTAVSVATAIEGAMKASKDTGPFAAIALAANIAAMVGAVLSGIAQATATLKKAQGSAPAKPKFSTGGMVDKSTSGGMVGRHTTTRTDDTISARLSLGEYVIRSSVVKALGVDFFDRLNGKQTKRKELPFKFATGGTVPSVTTVQNIQSQIDYTQMKEMFAEVVSEIQPVVSVREINDMQNRVAVKEYTSLQ